MAHVEQALIFVVDEQYYAIDSDNVVQILRVPDITHVPLVHDAITGICPIEGSITVVLDTRYLLSDEGEYINRTQEQARMVTIRYQDTVLAILVEEVISNVSVGDDLIRQKDMKENDPVQGILKYQDRIVQILSMEKLVREIRLPEYALKTIKDSLKSNEAASIEDGESVKYLFVMMGKEKFALNANMVREIIFYTENITEIANSPDEVLGMITLRNQVMVAIDLRVVFNMKSTIDENTRIVIVNQNQHYIGLLVDTILDIKDIVVSGIEPLPENYGKDMFRGVVKLGDELVSVIDDKKIHQLIEESKNFADAKSGLDQNFDSAHYINTEHTTEMVFFKLDKEEYAFKINDVEEIIRYSEVTTVPDSPSLFRGVINLRGSIIPVVSLHQRLGVDECIQEDSKILVCQIGEDSIGFIVDSVSEVMHVEVGSIKESDSSDELISKVIMLDEGKRIVLLLDPTKMIGCSDISDFSAKLEKTLSEVE